MESGFFGVQVLVQVFGLWGQDAIREPSLNKCLVNVHGDAEVVGRDPVLEGAFVPRTGSCPNTELAHSFFHSCCSSCVSSSLLLITETLRSLITCTTINLINNRPRGGPGSPQDPCSTRRTRQTTGRPRRNASLHGNLRRYLRHLGNLRKPASGSLVQKTVLAGCAENLRTWKPAKPAPM